MKTSSILVSFFKTQIKLVFWLPLKCADGRERERERERERGGGSRTERGRVEKEKEREITAQRGEDD